MWRVWGRGELCTGFWWEKSVGKRPLGRPRRRWEDNMKMDLQEVGEGCGDWMELAQVAGTCEYGDEPSGSKNAGNFLTSCRTS